MESQNTGSIVIECIISNYGYKNCLVIRIYFHLKQGGSLMQATSLANCVHFLVIIVEEMHITKTTFAFLFHDVSWLNNFWVMFIWRLLNFETKWKFVFFNRLNFTFLSRHNVFPRKGSRLSEVFYGRHFIVKIDIKASGWMISWDATFIFPLISTLRSATSQK